MGPTSLKEEFDMGGLLRLLILSMPWQIKRAMSVTPWLHTNEHEPDTVNASSNRVIEFDPGWRFYLEFPSLAVLAMTVSSDATSVSVALPVRLPPSSGFEVDETASYHYYRLGPYEVAWRVLRRCRRSVGSWVSVRACDRWGAGVRGYLGKCSPCL